MTTTIDNIVRGQTGTPPDDTNNLSRRSSSQTSRTSSESRRNKTLRGPRQHNSRSILSGEPKDDPSLTSFPSFSPDPNQGRLPKQGLSGVERTTSQKQRDRKATLAGLTNASPSLSKQNALFDDSPRSSLDIPGSVHLANDDHIERLIARTGAVKLIRQYARDLAHRDSEISALRVRADNRERELKKLLREAAVPSAEIEKRLLRLERSSSQHVPANRAKEDGGQTSPISLSGLMNEAITDQRSLSPIQASMSSQTTSGLPDPPSTLIKKERDHTQTTSVDHSNVTSHASSRANSIASQDSQDMEATLRPRQASSNVNRLSGLHSIFQPPASTSSATTSYFIGGSNKTLKKPKAVDELSVRSNQSGKSSTSWTRIFGGKAQATRSRASSMDQPQSPTQTGKDDENTSNVLSKVRTTTSTGPSKSSTSSIPARPRPPTKRTTTPSRLSTSPTHARKDSNASSLPPTVELDSMIESSQLPPTMSGHGNEGVLTDRFGFIYDRKRKRQQLQANRHSKNKLSAAESLASFRSADISASSDNPNRPSTPMSMDEDSPKKSWQDYLMPSTNVSKSRPRELLAHTPSAGAVVTVNSMGAEGTITPPRLRDVSISVSSTAQQALPTASSVSEPQYSTITATSADFTHDVEEESDAGATKALLDQLTDLHDSLQNERTVKWNDFLRRVRAERANNAGERTANNAPEADLVNGELIGIATLGRSSKTKGKYLHFKSLVLSGIPVALRPKVWAECSGASSLRIPGYYEELVAKSREGSGIEPEIASQISADVKRTLRDNIFFRSPEAPGVQRLEELLRAYSLHNPRIGYCQGMNLITASLLLICATSEDCFWLLVIIIDHILPSGYFDHSLLVVRADQIVLREYVAEVLPKLDMKLQELGVELEACTFHWFLSLYTGVLTGGEALYRVWDAVLCLNSSDTAPIALQSKSTAATFGVEGYLSSAQPTSPVTSTATNQAGNVAISENTSDHDGTCSPFLFQLSLALLKLNENAILSLDSPAMVYTYLNHNMTAHNITIDALINASEMLRSRIRRSEVLERRKRAVDSLT